MSLTLTSWADPMAEGEIVWELMAIHHRGLTGADAGRPLSDEALVSALDDGWEPFAVTPTGGGSFYFHLRRPQTDR
jgi:hypothetical protein